MSGEELEYWRELALSYRREIGLLRWRVLHFLESRSEESLVPRGDPSQADRIPRTNEMTATDVRTALDDLWSRASADG